MFTDPLASNNPIAEIFSQPQKLRYLRMQLAQYKSGKPFDTSAAIGQPCAICKKKIGTSVNTLPFVNEYGQQDGFMCPICVTQAEKMLAQQSDQVQQADNQSQIKTADHVNINIYDLSPDFTVLFSDDESAQDFIDSLSDYECSIIEQNKDNTELLKQIYQDVIEDLEDTAKSLAME